MRKGKRKKKVEKEGKKRKKTENRLLKRRTKENKKACSNNRETVIKEIKKIEKEKIKKRGGKPRKKDIFPEGTDKTEKKRTKRLRWKKTKRRKQEKS